MVTEAKTEITDIERRIAALTARRSRLWKYVESSRDLLDDEFPTGEMATAKSIMESSPELSAALTSNIPASRIWEAVSVVMRIEKRPVTVSEIADLLEKQRIVVGGEHPQENIRSAITRKEDVFEKVGRGLYALKEWPDAIKQMRKGESLSEVA